MFKGSNTSVWRGLPGGDGDLGTNLTKDCSCCGCEGYSVWREYSEEGMISLGSGLAGSWFGAWFYPLRRGETWGAFYAKVLRFSAGFTARANRYDSLTIFLIHVKLSNYD